MAFIQHGGLPRIEERQEAFELMLPHGSVPSLTFTWVNFEFGMNFCLDETLETRECIGSPVDCDARGVNHQAISSLNADYVFILFIPLHKKYYIYSEQH